MAGRPSKLTPEIHSEIVRWVELGGGRPEVAAAYAGVGKSTFYSWLKRGTEELSGPYREFTDAVRKANAAGELQLTATVRKDALENPTSAKWLLKERYWSRRGSGKKRKKRQPKPEDKASQIREALRAMEDSGPPRPISPPPSEGSAA